MSSSASDLDLDLERTWYRSSEYARRVELNGLVHKTFRIDVVAASMICKWVYSNGFSNFMISAVQSFRSLLPLSM